MDCAIAREMFFSVTSPCAKAGSESAKAAASPAAILTVGDMSVLPDDGWLRFSRSSELEAKSSELRADRECLLGAAADHAKKRCHRIVAHRIEARRLKPES